MKKLVSGVCLLVALTALGVAPKAWAQGGFSPEKYLMRQKELPAPYRVHDEENRFPAWSWDDGHWYRAGKDPEGMTPKDFDYKFIHEEIWNGNYNSIQVEGAVFGRADVAELRMSDQAKVRDYKKVGIGGAQALHETNEHGEFPRYYIQIGTVFGYVYGGQQSGEDTLAIAKLWVQKLQGQLTEQPQPKPPTPTATPAKDVPDLHVDSDGFALTLAGDNTVLEYEPAADKQSVAVQIENRSQKVPATNAFIQLYVASPAGSTPQPVGKQLALPTIPAGGKIAVGTTWDLGGQNQVDVELWVKVYIPYTDDANPADNQASLKCSIRYAHNGRRAFSWFDDTYRFVNFGYKDRETEELVEGVVATVLGNLQGGSEVSKVWQKLTFAAIYQRVESYMNKSLNAGAGGHCYGMAATAGLYFEGTAAPPLGKATPALTLEEASTNINIYHRAQMLPVLQALSSKGDYLQRDLSPRNCYNWVKNALDPSRLPPIVEFFGRDPGDKATIIGHAVLAYKLIEVEGRDPVIYIYDPNYPASAVKAPHPMPQISLKIDKATWANPTYMGYDWAVGEWIGARRVAREISVDMANALGPQLKAMAYTAVNALNQGKQLMAILRCPADVCFTDAQGRRTGMVNGKLVNEIPGAEPGSVGEVEMYLLPLGQNYSVTVTGTGAGTMSLDLLQAPTAGQLTAASFERVPVQKGGQLAGTLTGTGQLANLKSGSQTYPVQWSGSANLAAFNPGDGTSTPPPTTTTPPVQPKPPTPPTQPATANPPPVASTPPVATDPDRVVLSRPQANQLVDTTIEVVGRARPQTVVVVYTIVYNAQNGQMISTIPGIRAKTKDNGELAWVIAAPRVSFGQPNTPLIFELHARIIRSNGTDGPETVVRVRGASI
ncbi:MAG: hypothetical protein ABFE07_20400 [Armatimonadia bacterium]